MSLQRRSGMPFLWGHATVQLRIGTVHGSALWYSSHVNDCRSIHPSPQQYTLKDERPHNSARRTASNCGPLPPYQTNYWIKRTIAIVVCSNGRSKKCRHSSQFIARIIKGGTRQVAKANSKQQTANKQPNVLRKNWQGGIFFQQCMSIICISFFVSRYCSKWLLKYAFDSNKRQYIDAYFN